jgi:hypothetical protein
VAKGSFNSVSNRRYGDECPPEEIADATPAEYQLGGRDVFIDVLAASKSMFPVSGRFDPIDLERARQFLATFDEKVRTSAIRIEDTYTNRFVDAVPAGIAADIRSGIQAGAAKPAP